MQRISYTFDSYSLFSAVLNFFTLWEVEGAYCPPLHTDLQTWAAGQTVLSDVALGLAAPQLSLLPPRPRGDQTEAPELARNSDLKGSVSGTC